MGGVALVAAGAGAVRVAVRCGIWPSSRLRTLAPRTLREASLAAACLDLAELLRVGVPLTDSLRVVAPALTGPVGRGLGRRLDACAERIERGESLGQTLDDAVWFDHELVRLVGVGESAGELHAVLRQVGAARSRRTRRRIDRIAATLEPAVILVLAALVGLVVMSAVLPMLRLQEVI